MHATPDDPAEMRVLYTDVSIRDAKLTDEGVKQCIDRGRECGHALDFHTVFISPLRRAFLTAIEIFKDHPNKENIKFVLHPFLREHIFTFGDLPQEITKTIEELGDQLPNLDTSLFFNPDGSPRQRYYLEGFLTNAPVDI